MDILTIGADRVRIPLVLDRAGKGDVLADFERAIYRGDLGGEVGFTRRHIGRIYLPPIALEACQPAREGFDAVAVNGIAGKTARPECIIIKIEEILGTSRYPLYFRIIGAPCALAAVEGVSFLALHIRIPGNPQCFRIRNTLRHALNDRGGRGFGGYSDISAVG